MATFIPNPVVASELEHSEAVRRACLERAQTGAEFARQIAPVESGTYRDSIHAEETADGAIIVADATNSDGEGYSAYVEVGTSTHPAHHTLANAAAALGHL